MDRTIRDYLFPDELDRYEAALDRGDVKGIIQVFNAEKPTDPAVMFPDRDLDEQAWMFKKGADTYGGGFVQQLAKAYLHADPHNARRIRSTWPEYWIKYVLFSEHAETDAS